MADVVIDSENENPKDLYGQGVRAYVLQDYSSAVTALGKASELMVIEHGDDLHEALGEVYLYYGKALLGLSREESEALGDAVPRNEGSSEEDNVEDGEENGAETNENDENEIKATEEESNGDKNPTVNDVEDEKPTNGSGEGTSNGVTREDVEKEAEDEPTDLQLAWEVLELAKKIFEKQGDSAKKHLGETLTVLGEVSLESENFESAVTDISEGLKIQKELFDKDSRTVAETYYKLGVAYSTTSQIEAAINSFNSSLEYLNNRIATLEKSEEKNKETEEEIKEIKSLIPDIEEKVSDMKTYKDEAMKNIFTALKDGTKTESPSTSTSASKPVTDISHLVKRKRKVDEQDSTSEEQPSKKINQL